MAPRRVQKIPLICVGNADPLQAKVGEEDQRSGSTQANGEFVIVRSMMGIDLTFEQPFGDHAHDNHHGKPGKDARNKEEGREKFRIPQRMQLSRGKKKQGAECRLVKRRQNHAEDGCSDGHF